MAEPTFWFEQNETCWACFGTEKLSPDQVRELGYQGIRVLKAGKNFTAVLKAKVEQMAPEEADSALEIEAEVSPDSQYTTHVPVYDLFVAAGDWGIEGSPTVIGWIEAGGQPLLEGMFAAQVTGHSMQPRIPSGSWCLFRPCPPGSRQGKLLLVQVNTHLDPEDGGRYTVKRYHSTKQVHKEAWTHETIELQPLNPDYRPIPITEDDADSIRVVGEFVAVIG